MSYKGKEFTPEMIDFVINLKKYYDDEKNAGSMVSTKNAVKRTANGLGIGEATVKKIMASYNKSNQKVVMQYSKPREKRVYTVSDNLQPIIREFIRSKNISGRRVSIEKLRNYLADQFKAEIPITTLWTCLKRWEFIYVTGRGISTLRESDDVIVARRKYLRAKKSNRNHDGTLKRPEIYLGETYVHKNDPNRFTWYLDKHGPWINKPTGNEHQFAIINAITRDGWVNGAELILQQKTKADDYNGKVNQEIFLMWFITRLLPNIPSKSIIIMDNAHYHNGLSGQAFPTSKTSRRKMREWLRKNNYPWTKDMLKPELFALCKRVAPTPECEIDRLAEAQGHVVLRTPQYHPELHPMETCWAIVKGQIQDKSELTIDNFKKLLCELFNKTSVLSCNDLLFKVEQQERRYWREDKKIDEIDDGDQELEYFNDDIQLDGDNDNEYD